jgi:phytoene desaturase
MNKKVLIVGAGLGGLATALRLTKKGYSVRILEKNHQAGGRLNQIVKDGFTFDTGPSFFSMSYEFEQFAKDCNIKLPFEYVELDPLYSVNFSNSPKTWFLHKDIKKLSEQFKDVEPDFEQKMLKYLDNSGQLFHDTIDIVVKNNFDSILEYFVALTKVDPKHLPILTRSFWKQVTLNFSSKEAQQIVSLVAFFLGRTPFDTMAIYTLLSYTEFMHDGYYNVKGGMYNIVKGLVNELEKENVEIYYNTEIINYNHTKDEITDLIDNNGKKWSSDIFVINADAAVFRNKILKHPNFSDSKMKKKNWTMGYLTFYLGIKTKLDNVNHHNYFLGDNYKDYSSKLLRKTNNKQKPYYYVNVVSKHNKDCAPEGCESLFFVCPVPNLLFKKSWEDKDAVVNSIIEDFSKRININIVPEIVSKTIFTPEDWEKQYNLYKGSCLGLSHTMFQIGAFRPKNYDEKYKNTFYVGASTTPGAGLPMSIISSKLVVDRIEKRC